MRKILAFLLIVGLLGFRTDALESDDSLNEVDEGLNSLEEEDLNDTSMEELEEDEEENFDLGELEDDDSEEFQVEGEEERRKRNFPGCITYDCNVRKCKARCGSRYKGTQRAKVHKRNLCKKGCDRDYGNPRKKKTPRKKCDDNLCKLKMCVDRCKGPKCKASCNKRFGSEAPAKTAADCKGDKGCLRTLCNNLCNKEFTQARDRTTCQKMCDIWHQLV